MRKNELIEKVCNEIRNNPVDYTELVENLVKQSLKSWTKQELLRFVTPE
jgi:hypothetical protein